jgi:hypothetical protein
MIAVQTGPAKVSRIFSDSNYRLKFFFEEILLGKLRGDGCLQDEKLI